MYVDIGRVLPQEFNTKERCLQWCKNKQLGLKHSLRLLALDKEFLIIRCPIVNEDVTIYGEPDEIKWLHLELVKADAYTYK